jgi:hypothetical protein
VCSAFLIQVVANKHFNKQPNIILVQSDLFKDVSYIKLEELIKDEKVKNLFFTKDKIDIDFKIALFYSDLSIVILNKSKKEKDVKRYVADIHMRSLKKWDALAKKDKSMLFFKHYYIKMYKKNLESKTN